MRTSSKILVVDDDELMRSMLVEMLRTEGFEDIYELGSGEKVLDTVKQHEIDLVLLDISMPGKDGLTLTRELRATYEEIGIILVTGKGDDIDKIVGIEVGADDYLVKPVKLRELQARVKNLVQRVRREKNKAETIPQEKDADEKRIGKWCFKPAKQLLVDESGNSQELTHGEQSILKLLTNRPGNVYSRDQLLQAVTERDWSPYDRTIDVLIGRLRKKIELDPKRPAHLITVRGVGYKCIS
ncbi:response regulator transcription factor [Aliikangiella marina]|uniref:Response regulator transcription factor n=1 Tax=Aliikangiella marina TaxID=1712262 RepID=A0A545TBV5_9GAMM|nr:response regulator transcription factor [Aliikangiella marina]TQV74705.1 response regulator transcription factor [Aliikangiella marina]